MPSRRLFSLETLAATHDLPASEAIEPADWLTDDDRVILLAGDGMENSVSACRSYSAAELDRFGVPFRFRFEQSFRAIEPNQSAIILNQATVVGDSGVVLDRHGAVVLESLWPTGRHRPFEAIRAIPEFARYEGDARFDDDVFLLFRGGGFENYWHFHADMLPIVSAVDELGLKRSFKFAVPTLKAWHRRALARMGVDPGRIIEVAGRDAQFRRCILFSTMFHPSVTLPHRFARATFRRLHESTAAIRDRQRANALEPRRLIYVARTDGIARLLINEAELIDALTRMGFEIIVPTKLSYDEQLEVFAGAAVIVGAHGAGLTNIVAADKGALLVEIFPYALLTAPHYFLLAKSCGLSYEMYISRLRSQISVHDHWTLDVEPFLIRLLVLLQRYGFGCRDALLRTLNDAPTVDFAFRNATAIPLGADAAPYPCSLFGFSGHEEWGSWLVERDGAILFHFPLPLRFEITLDVVYYAPSLSAGLVIECGQTRHTLTEASSPLVFTVENPAGKRSLWLEVPGAISPATHLDEVGQDDRAMSIGIRTIEIRTCSLEG